MGRNTLSSADLSRYGTRLLIPMEYHMTSTTTTSADLTKEQATALDTEIRALAQTIDGQLSTLADLIVQARDGAIHKALGFDDLAAYLVDVTKKHMPKLTASDRIEAVRMLTDAGMTVRDIATALHTGKSQISRDQQAAKGRRSPGPRSELDKSLAEIKRVEGRTYSDSERREVVAALRAVATKLGHPAGKSKAA